MIVAGTGEGTGDTSGQPFLRYQEANMDIHRELDRIIIAIESGEHGPYVMRLLHWWKAILEELVP